MHVQVCLYCQMQSVEESSLRFVVLVKGTCSMTHLQVLHISMKFLLQVASDIQKIL